MFKLGVPWKDILKTAVLQQTVLAFHVAFVSFNVVFSLIFYTVIVFISVLDLFPV